MNKRQKEALQVLFGNEKAVLEKLEFYYRAALMDITDRIKILQADEMSQSKVHQKQYQELLKQQVEATIAKLHGQEYETIEQFVESAYEDGFVGTMYDLHGQRVPVIAPIDRKAMVNAVLNDSKINEKLYKELGQDLSTLKTTIRREITRGVAANTSWRDIARNINWQTGIPLRRAKTIAQTEGHRVQEEAAEDARTAAVNAGADVVKQWDATMDSKTRPSHQAVDGEIRETNQKFSNGLMYPGDSSGPASEVIRCRCHALTRSRKALDADELATLQKRAEFFGLDKTDSFAEFKKKYLKAAETIAKAPETLEKSGKSGTINTKQTARKIKDGTTVVNPMDAGKYAKLKANLQKKGVIVMQAKGDDLEYMRALGAEATYGGGYIMHIGEIPSASALYEEIIHWTQAKKYGELASTEPVELCAREVAANRKLLQNGNAYGFDEVDFEDIQRNLARWEAKFEELAGVSYDESDYQRDV